LKSVTPEHLERNPTSNVFLSMLFLNYAALMENPISMEEEEEGRTTIIYFPANFVNMACHMGINALTDKKTSSALKKW